MKTIRIGSAAFVMICAVAVSAAAQRADIKDSKDHPLFTRLPNTYIWRYEQKEFDVHQFRQANGEKLPVEERPRPPSGRSDTIQ